GAILHERTEHLWGVAQGLELTTKPNTDGNKKYVDVSLSPGRAVDRLGRAIVVTTALPPDPTLFPGQIATPDPPKPSPAVLQAVDVPQLGDTQPGKCGVTLTTRIEEGLQISFGNPGTEISIVDAQPATVDEGLGTSTDDDKVLVGWVQFDPTISNNEGR